ncbi:MAG: hypothetical protein HY329_15775 [Chloroflexi bacterium]|nr:hypothetical protein [Chloroflexota bacterium]
MVVRSRFQVRVEKERRSAVDTVGAACEVVGSGRPDVDRIVVVGLPEGDSLRGAIERESIDLPVEVSFEAMGSDTEVTVERAKPLLLEFAPSEAEKESALARLLAKMKKVRVAG